VKLRKVIKNRQKIGRKQVGKFEVAGVVQEIITDP